MFLQNRALRSETQKQYGRCVRGGGMQVCYMYLCFESVALVIDMTLQYLPLILMQIFISITMLLSHCYHDIPVSHMQMVGKLLLPRDKRKERRSVKLFRYEYTVQEHSCTLAEWSSVTTILGHQNVCTSLRESLNYHCEYCGILPCASKPFRLVHVCIQL